MKVYKGVSASPGLVLGQVSRLEHHVETFSHGPFNPERARRKPPPVDIICSMQSTVL